MTCYTHRDECVNYPDKCRECFAMSNIYNTHPLYEKKPVGTVHGMLSPSTREGCFCVFCGTDKSVKYLVNVEGKDGRKFTACCCNRCVAGKLVRGEKV